jgi:NDP-sugar pyrophosphorylase family protein
MAREVTKVMILSAGEGTRLRPLTLETPKVLLPIEGRPLIEYTLTWLKSHGISEVAINLYHLGDKIKDLLGDGSRFGMRVVYSEEETLLGTAGGVKKMEHFFDGTFVVFYGDNLTDFNLSTMVKFHREKKALATLATFEMSNPWEVGIVEMNDEGRVLSLVEKPQSPISNLANGGVYVLEKEILRYIPRQGFSDFASDIFPKLIELGLPIYGYRLKPEDYFIDIGTMSKYQKVNEDVKAGKVRIKYG